MHLIEEKDKEFHRRIVKNRVNPSAQSYNNPVPDYYGVCLRFWLNLCLMYQLFRQGRRSVLYTNIDRSVPCPSLQRTRLILALVVA